MRPQINRSKVHTVRPHPADVCSRNCTR